MADECRTQYDFARWAHDPAFVSAFDAYAGTIVFGNLSLLQAVTLTIDVAVEGPTLSYLRSVYIEMLEELEATDEH